MPAASGENSTVPPPSTPHGKVLGHADADACFSTGLRPDALHEVFCARPGHEAAATGFAIALAIVAAGSSRPLLWVRQDLCASEAGEAYPHGLGELGLAPDRIVSVLVGDAAGAMRAAWDGVRCAGLGAVLVEPWGEPRVLDHVVTRRLTLAATHSGVAVIALRLAARAAPSAAETRWVIAGVRSPRRGSLSEPWGMPRFDAALVRNRHGPTGRWIMEWDNESGLFRAPRQNAFPLRRDTPHPGAAAPHAGHRPAAAAASALHRVG